MGDEPKIAIIGAGLAGVSLATALLERGVDSSRLHLFDGGDPRRGSSVPATMIHPFPGRAMTFRRGQADAFIRSWGRLQRWNEQCGGRFSRPAPMIRPLTDDERGQRLQKTWLEARADYPDLIECREVGPGELNERFPQFQSTVPALVYSPAAAIILPDLVDALLGRLESGGVTVHRRQVHALQDLGGHWRLDTESGKTTFDQVVLAVGASLDRIFPNLDLRRRAGEVLIFDPGECELSALFNGGKHICQRPDGYWGLGSTYFDPADWQERDDEVVAKALIAGVNQFLPIVNDLPIIEVGRAVRGVFGSDHMPLAGAVPGRDGLYVLAAFGSKGLLWAPAVAADVAALLVGDAQALSPHVEARRMALRHWATAGDEVMRFARSPVLG